MNRTLRLSAADVVHPHRSGEDIIGWSRTPPTHPPFVVLAARAHDLSGRAAAITVDKAPLAGNERADAHLRKSCPKRPPRNWDAIFRRSDGALVSDS